MKLAEVIHTLDQQVQRLSGLDGFPRSPEGVASLRDAIWEAAKGDAQRVKAIVAGYVRYSSKCPKPAEILRQPPPPAEDEAETRPPIGSGRDGCPLCQGVGYVPWPALATFSPNGRTVQRLYFPAELWQKYALGRYDGGWPLRFQEAAAEHRAHWGARVQAARQAGQAPPARQDWYDLQARCPACYRRHAQPDADRKLQSAGEVA